MLYVCVMYVVIFVCIVRCGAVGACVWGVFRHADVVSCVHPVAVLNVAFCMTCSLLMLTEDARDDRGILQSRYHDCLVGSHECLFCLPHPVAMSAFIICRCLCACTEML